MIGYRVYADRCDGCNAPWNGSCTQETNMEPRRKKQKTRSEQAREREQRRLKEREDAISSMDIDKDVYLTRIQRFLRKEKEVECRFRVVDGVINIDSRRRAGFRFSSNALFQLENDNGERQVLVRKLHDNIYEAITMDQQGFHTFINRNVWFNNSRVTKIRLCSHSQFENIQIVEDTPVNDDASKGDDPATQPPAVPTNRCELSNSSNRTRKSPRVRRQEYEKKKAARKEKREADKARVVRIENLTEAQKKLEDALYDSVQVSSTTFDQIKGLDTIVGNIKSDIKLRARLSLEQPWRLDGRRVAGYFLYGAPGCGKTMIAHAISNEFDDSIFFSVKASTILSRWCGESEKTVDTLFRLARKQTRSILFIDECEKFFTDRRSLGEDNNNKCDIMSQFLEEMENEENENLVFVACTNLPQRVDGAVLRRFSRHEYVPLPDFNGRLAALRYNLSRENFENVVTEEKLKDIANKTHGFSMKDISNIVAEAQAIVENEWMETQTDEVRDIKDDDFDRVLSEYKSTVKAADVNICEMYKKSLSGAVSSATNDTLSLNTNTTAPEMLPSNTNNKPFAKCEAAFNQFLINFPEGSEARKSFIQEIEKGFNKILFGAFNRCMVTDLSAGSVIVHFLILPPVKGCDVPTADAVQHLGNVIGDKNSDLYKHQATRDIMSERSLKMEYITFDKIELKHRKNIIQYFCDNYNVQASDDMITVLATYNHEFLNHGAGLEPICKMLPFWESQPFESPIQRVKAIVTWFKLHDDGDEILTNRQQHRASFQLELFDAICNIEESEWAEIADAAMVKELRKRNIHLMCIEFENKIVNKDTLIDKINKWVKK